MTFSLFISDLHLHQSRPLINQVFFDFLKNVAVQAESLYVLGDLFEYWAGDDDLKDDFNSEACSALVRLTAQGVALYVMHGNRDFLIGEAFARTCGAKLLPDPYITNIHGVSTLLMHGDTLCRDDVKYQAFRAKVRDPAWQKAFLAQPLSSRKETIEQLRRTSEQEIGEKTAAIMDVTPAAVEEVLREYRYPRLIHGHTHRPAKHIHSVDGKTCERWVLSDWYEHGEYLRCDQSGCTVVKL